MDVHIDALSANAKTSFVVVTAGISKILIDCDAVPLSVSSSAPLQLKSALPTSDELASVDVVLLTSFDAFLALPYLTRHTDFQGRIFATLPTSKLGQLHASNLLETSAFQQSFPVNTRDLGVQSTAKRARAAVDSVWNNAPEHFHRPIYSQAELQYCLSRVEVVSYGEFRNIGGQLAITAWPSGACVGGTLWEVETIVPPPVVASSRDTLSTSGAGRRIPHGPRTLRIIVGNRVAAVTNRLCMPLKVPVLRLSHHLLILSHHTSCLSPQQASAAGPTSAMSVKLSDRGRGHDVGAAASTAAPICQCGLDCRDATSLSNFNGPYEAVFKSFCSTVRKELRRGKIVILPVVASGGFLHELLHHLKLLSINAAEKYDSKRKYGSPEPVQKGDTQHCRVSGRPGKVNPLSLCRLVFLGAALKRGVEIANLLSEWTTIARKAPDMLVSANTDFAAGPPGGGRAAGQSWESILTFNKSGVSNSERTASAKHEDRCFFVDTVSEVIACLRRKNRMVLPGKNCGVLLFVNHWPTLVNTILIRLCHGLSSFCADGERSFIDAPRPRLSLIYTHVCPGFVRWVLRLCLHFCAATHVQGTFWTSVCACTGSTLAPIRWK